MRILVREVRLALRQLRKSPAFAVTVVLMLALGIGATTAIFSLVEGILLRPLAFRDPGRLVLAGDHVGGREGISATAREIRAYPTAARALSSVGGYITASFEVSGGGVAEEVNGARLGADVFTTLGVSPMLGRVFTRAEDEGHEPVAVIRYAMWKERYHSDPEALGKPIVLDRKAYSIVGVMPPSFAFPLADGRLEQAQVWVPLSLTAEELSEQQAGFWGYHMVARLKEGISLEQAARDANRIAIDTMKNFPASLSAIHIDGDVAPLKEFAVGEVRPVLRALFLGVSIVLVIACVNAAGLLLVRAIRRRRECALRLALGAGAWTILRESMLEGLLLSLAGGVLGLGFATVAIRTVLGLLPESIPRLDSISMDTNVAAFCLLVALASGVLCGLAPAFAALRTNVIEGLKEGERANSGGASHSRLRSALVVAEVAIALVLLTMSGAFLRSMEKMRDVDPGFRADHVVVAGYQLPLNQYATGDSAERFDREVIERLTSMPGILAAGITGALPATGFSRQAGYTIEDQDPEGWKLKFAAFTTTYGDYFHALGIRLLDGRTFTNEDRANAPLVVIVNESMARNCWPGRRAVGKRMHVGGPKKGLPWATVVGVVADTKLGGRDEESIEQWYTPEQQPTTLFGTEYAGKLVDRAGGYITLRSALPPEQMTQTLRSTVAEVDPLLALEEVQPMTQAMENIEAPRRFNTSLITAFALSAFLLAISGVYAVVAFSVSLRTQEMAIRMALGAQRSGITRLVLISGAKLALLGCGLGVLGALAASRLVTSLLFEVSATDPVIYFAAAILMVLMALLAAWFPARRAATADPIAALRAI